MSLTENDHERHALVLDIGSCMIKAGFAFEDNPRVVFPNITGKVKYEKGMADTETKDTYVGEEAQLKRGFLKISHPMQLGIVQNWDDMEKVVHHTLYNELRAKPEDQPALLTEIALNSRSNREKMMEMMFETFNVPEYYTKLQPMLSLFASGRVSGIALEVGDGVSHVFPVYEGSTIPRAINRINLGGSDITSYLAKILSEKGYRLTTSAEMEIVRDIKEKLGYCALDFDNEIQSSKTHSSSCSASYTLPDGNVITIDTERFRCTEVLFNPSLIGMESQGLHELVYDSIMKCDIDTRSDIYCNIILSGGSTMFKEFPKRMHKEMRTLVPPRMKCNTISYPEWKYNAWSGGSIIAALTCFQKLWVTKQQYQENGAGIVHQKCLY